MQYLLRRESKEGTCTVYKGTMAEVTEWVTDVVKRNKYTCTVLTDLNMLPVWSCEDRVFFIRKAGS